MEIAQGSIRRNPHSVFPRIGMTPAEVLLLHGIHFQNAQGSPLGDDFKVYGEAMTVESPGKPAEAEYTDTHGKVHPAVPEVKAKVHKRTNAEEVARLRKIYSNARIRQEDGSEVSAFTSVFPGIMPKLPQTFDEIEEACGMKFPPLTVEDDSELSEEQQYRAILLKKPRAELVRMALEAKLQVSVEDDNKDIVAKLTAVAAEAEATPQANAREELMAKKKEQLVLIAQQGNVTIPDGATKAAIVELILEKAGYKPAPVGASDPQ